MTLLNNILPEIRRSKLKTLLKRDQIVRVLEAHNGLSGIIANNARVEGQTNEVQVQREFDAIWESSLTDSASKGHPDIEVISFDSRLQSINEILVNTEVGQNYGSVLENVKNVPIIFDSDQNT
ncbi:MAG: hypothetical protein HOD90_00635, partial [Nitrospina sp.]|nr:hypothetical protein [Nitrospina sp.]